MEKKLISFCVPCYNAEKDMRKCLDSLLTNKDKVEILIINDGSKDGTAKIADEYAEKYPECVKAIHQENRGHGGGINHAIELATGKFFKVVDSDDWVDQNGYAELLSKIEKFGDEVDMFICDYAYFYVDRIRKRIKFNHVLKNNQVVTWDAVRRFHTWENLTLHSTMYRLDVLKKSKVVLPEKTFYEDNYFVYASLPYVKTLYYLPSVFYIYFIGREGQSVGFEKMKERYKMHYLIAHLMNNEYDPYEYKKTSKNLYKTMIHHLVLINSIGYIYPRLNGSDDAKETYHKLRNETKAEHPRLYRKLKYGSVCGFTMVHGPFGVFLVRFSLRFARLFVPFC